MTNDYDAAPYVTNTPRDLDDPRQAHYPSGISPGFTAQPSRDIAEASSIRSRLATNLRSAAEEARNLETFYSNFAQTLELCLSQLETRK